MDIKIDITNTYIETPRILLRPWKENDVGDMYEYASIDGVGEMAGWKHHESIDETEKIVRSFMADKNVFALELKSNGKAVGSLGLHYSWANDDPQFARLKVKEIGYVLSKTYWGMGLMPEAVNRVIEYCFKELNLEALTVGHYIGNDQSKRVIEKCGFKYVKQVESEVKALQKKLLEDVYILYR